MSGISTTSKGAFAPFDVLILLGSGIVALIGVEPRFL